MYFQYANDYILQEYIMNMLMFKMLSLECFFNGQIYLAFGFMSSLKLAIVVDKLILSVPSKYVFTN